MTNETKDWTPSGSSNAESMTREEPINGDFKEASVATDIVVEVPSTSKMDSEDNDNDALPLSSNNIIAADVEKHEAKSVAAEAPPIGGEPLPTSTDNNDDDHPSENAVISPSPTDDEDSDIEAAYESTGQRNSMEGKDRQISSPPLKDTDASVSLTSSDDHGSLDDPATSDDDNDDKPSSTMLRVPIVKSVWIQLSRKIQKHPRRAALIALSTISVFILLVTVVAILSTRSSDSHSNNDSTQTTMAPSAAPLATRPYVPGRLSVSENGLLLSQGLSSKIIAISGKPVKYPLTATQSTINCHSQIDFGATFAMNGNENNESGWIYVSNAEVDDNDGGVGAFTFDALGNVVDYKMLLTNTSRNCGGGKTPWNAYITCEEVSGGRCYQVDPYGVRETQMITVGSETNGGKFESFASWTKKHLMSHPHFFITEDDKNGTVRRFIPDVVDWTDPWSMLVGPGTTMHLLLHSSNMTFSWTSNLEEAKTNAGEHYPGSEGIDEFEDHLYIVSKLLKKLVILNLLDGSYIEQSTDIGRFDGQPDQVVRIELPEASDTIYFTQDGGTSRGIAARNAHGTYTIATTVVYDKKEETTGLSFSPDGKYMYFSLQEAGILYEISRNDRQGFHVESPHIMYETDAY